MAVLKAISYEKGYDQTSAWFNRTETAKSLYPKPYFDISDWIDLSIQYNSGSFELLDIDQNEKLSPDELDGLWEIDKKKLTYTAPAPYSKTENGVVVDEGVRTVSATWHGTFELEGDRVVNGNITKFERDWGAAGEIQITNLSLPISDAVPGISVFSLPEEITTQINEEEVQKLSPGEQINFKTKYDSNSTDLHPQLLNKAISKPSQFNKKSADKITNFNPSTDTLEIDTDSFGIDSSGTFATGASQKEVKKVLAKQDFDFLYDQKKGGLYFNENGAEKGFGDGGIIAIFKGAPELTSDNLEFI
jgi:hypothetical protein